MDQGFNDDELADIMNEIESLEKEFGDDAPEQKVEDKKEDASESQDEEHDHEQQVESGVVAMKGEELEKVQASSHDDENIHHLKHQNQDKKVSGHPKKQSSMDFSVQGDMQLNLKFNIGGQVVMLTIDDHQFDIELEQGMKFSLPLDHKKSA